MSLFSSVVVALAALVLKFLPSRHLSRLHLYCLRANVRSLPTFVGALRQKNNSMVFALPRLLVFVFSNVQISPNLDFLGNGF